MNARTKPDLTPKPVEPASAAIVAPAQPATAQAETASRKGRRRLIMLSLPVILLVGGGYVWLSGGRYETTENANLHEARVAIASDLPGRVTEVDFVDNQPVKAGDVLFRVDAQPYQLALNEANAALSAARLKVEQTKATYRQSVAQEAVARDNVTFRQTELDRQTALSNRGVSTAANLDEAQFALRQAKEQLSAIEQSTASIEASLGGSPDIPTDTHPSVVAALATVDRATYNLGLATVRAPADGTVYQAASFRQGMFVAAGAPLFALVESGDVWIDANFKEDQLTNIRPGQTATITFDMIPGQTFNALVDSIGAGTGAEFSLIPAQNATGNWVKVTQRVPVRLKLTSALPDGFNVSGASAVVSVDTKVTRQIFGYDLSALK